jgi:tetratricopeptide (TPR) repeat protein
VGLLDKLLGRGKLDAASQVREGIAILDRAIQYGPKLVKCHYKKGERARDLFRRAVELEPRNAHLHMLYAVSHFYCADPKTAQTEIEAACAKDPNDFEVRGLLDWAPWWRDIFHVPPWSLSAARVPPIYGEYIKGKVVLPVREGDRRVNSFFFRRPNREEFADHVSNQAHCRMYPHVIESPYLWAVAVVGCVKDRPENPLKAETFMAPGAGTEGRDSLIGLLQLARQDSMFLVVIDEADRVIFNVRVALDAHAREVFARAAELAPRYKDQEVTRDALLRTIQWYDAHFSTRPIEI